MTRSKPSTQKDVITPVEEYQKIMQEWLRAVTERQRQLVASKPLVEIRREKHAEHSPHSQTSRRLGNVK